MRILNTQELQLQPTDTLFGPSKAKSIIVFLVCLALLGPWPVITFTSGQWVTFAIFAFICVIVLLATGTTVIDSFKKDSWRVAVRKDSILLKADLTDKNSREILEIQFSEITSFRKLCEQYYVYRKRKKGYYLKQVRFMSLDLELADETFTQLQSLDTAQAIGLEMKAPNRLIYTAGVFMLNVNKIADLLEGSCRMEQECAFKLDKPNPKDKQQNEDYIRFLVRRDEDFAARKWVKKVFGCDSSECENYVANLLQNAAESK